MPQDETNCNHQDSITVCVPVYKPPLHFFQELEKFQSDAELEINLVLCFTLDEEISQEHLLSMTNSVKKNFSRIEIYSVRKEDFHHSKTRNFMVRKVPRSDYLLFTTQDVFFMPEISEALKYTITEMRKSNAVGACFRHESPVPAMNAVFDNIFKNLSSEKYLNCESEAVYWWSNNFAIYDYNVIVSIPFPEVVSWAEDLAWAKMVSKLGRKLLVTTKFKISHLNDDTITTAFRRGKENARGLYEVSSTSFEHIPTFSYSRDLFRAAFGMYKLEVKYHHRRGNLLSEIFSISWKILLWAAQAFGRISTLQKIRNGSST